MLSETVNLAKKGTSNEGGERSEPPGSWAPQAPGGLRPPSKLYKAGRNCMANKYLFTEIYRNKYLFAILNIFQVLYFQQYNKYLYFGMNVNIDLPCSTFYLVLVLFS